MERITYGRASLLCTLLLWAIQGKSLWDFLRLRLSLGHRVTLAFHIMLVNWVLFLVVLGFFFLLPSAFSFHFSTSHARDLQNIRVHTAPLSLTTLVCLFDIIKQPVTRFKTKSTPTDTRQTSGCLCFLGAAEIIFKLNWCSLESQSGKPQRALDAHGLCHDPSFPRHDQVPKKYKVNIIMLHKVLAWRKYWSQVLNESRKRDVFLIHCATARTAVWTLQLFHIWPTGFVSLAGSVPCPLYTLSSFPLSQNKYINRDRLHPKVYY